MAAVGYPWRFVVTDRDSAILTFLDRLASNRSIQAGLNVPWSISGEVPSDSSEINLLAGDGDPLLSYNDRFLYAFREEEAPGWTCRASGIVMQIEDVAASDQGTSRFTAYDPWKYLYSRPIVNDNGTLPTNVKSYTNRPGNEIALDLLTNTDVAHGSCYIDYGQTLDYAGHIDTTDNLTIDFDQGTSVGEAWEQLVATGSMDIHLKPIYEPSARPGFLAELSIYSFYGTDRHEAVMAWDKPSRSLTGISHLRDGTAMANKVQGYTVDGRLGGPVQTNAGSVTKYGQYWLQDFTPSESNAAVAELLALSELLLRRRGKESLTVTPAPERSPVPLRDYFPGDSVPIYASAKLRQEVSALKRVYAIPITLRDDGTETVDQLLVTEPDV